MKGFGINDMKEFAVFVKTTLSFSVKVVIYSVRVNEDWSITLPSVSIRAGKRRIYRAKALLNFLLLLMVHVAAKDAD